MFGWVQSLEEDGQVRAGAAVLTFWSDALPRLEAKARFWSRADHPYAVYYYLRAAQAYMLISMPTCTSTIFGVFQVIRGLLRIVARCSCRSEGKATSDATQVFTSTL